MHYHLTCNLLGKVLADSLSLNILWSEIITILFLIPPCINTSTILHNFEEVKHHLNALKHNVSPPDCIRKISWE